jgi:hypothetical protein
VEREVEWRCPREGRKGGKVRREEQCMCDEREINREREKREREREKGWGCVSVYSC